MKRDGKRTEQGQGRRDLTEAERKRAERFARSAEEMERQGYVRHDLLIGIVGANLFALGLLIPLFVVGFGLYYAVHHRLDLAHLHPLLFVVAFVVLVVVHELIHGACWSLFTPRRFRDIQFGFMRSSLTPYCTCLAPLKKGQYLFGTAMPLVLLGLLPMAAGIAAGDPTVLFLGAVMADGAAGDVLVIRRILGYRSEAGETVYMDHPTEAGCVVFQRERAGR